MEGNRVAIIGSGCSGIAAIKCCLEERLVPTCFERRDAIGGLWCFTTEVKQGHVSVMSNTVTILSKEFMCYSDFLMPQSFPNFLRHDKLRKYFNQYADHFDLKRYIEFGHEVITLKKAEDFHHTGRWLVTVKKTVTKSEFTQIFDYVIVCSGAYNVTYTPQFPGQEKFQGKIVHSHNVRSTKGFRGKRVVVIGLGNSGCDVAVNLCRVTNQVITPVQVFYIRRW